MLVPREQRPQTGPPAPVTGPRPADKRTTTTSGIRTGTKPTQKLGPEPRPDEPYRPSREPSAGGSQEQSSPNAVLAALKAVHTRLEEAVSAVDRSPPQADDITKAQDALREASAMLEAQPWTGLADTAAKLQQKRLDPQSLDPPAAAHPAALARRLPPEVWEAVARQLEETDLLKVDGAPTDPTPADQIGTLVEDRFAGLGNADSVQVVVTTTVMPVLVVDGTRSAVQRFLDTVAKYTAGPAPAASDPATPAWVDKFRNVLREAYTVVTNILVAAAFSLPSVQEAAQEAASSITPHLPSLLAVSIVGALGLRLARDLGGIRSV